LIGVAMKTLQEKLNFVLAYRTKYGSSKALIADCEDYLHRSIFIDTEDTAYVINNEGGVDHFSTSVEAIRHIQARPNRYPLNNFKE